MHLTFYQPLWWLLGILMLALGFWFTLVDRPRRFMVWSFALRCLAVVFLILALCRPGIMKKADEVHVVFLVDVSQSVDLGAARAAVAEVKEAASHLLPGDSQTLFALANGVRVFTPDDLDKTLESWQKGIADDEFRSASRLAEALLATRLSFPAGKSRRLVLLTDGLETHGQVSSALDTLRKEDVDVVWKRLSGLTEPEASVVSVEPSTPNAFSGEVVRMRIKLAANQPIKGLVHLTHQGVRMMSKPVELSPERENLVEMDVDMRTPGTSLWTAELEPEKDHFPLNNQATATVQVKGKSRILVVHQEPKDMRPLSRALQEQEFDVDVRGKNGLPETLESLMTFDAIVLADVAATDIPTRQMELLKRYVQDFGGGLAMLGSENSFGLGGYYKTPVEDVLPLVSRFEKEKEKPSLAMVMVIDKSGSMEGLPIALCRQAAKAAVELLGPQDQVAVVGFDSNPQLISEMRRAGEKEAIQSAIDSLEASGGTDLYPGMVMGKELLDNTTAKVKHMICLTDGQTPDADFPGLVQSLRDGGVTISSVAMGDSAATEVLQLIAEMGKGRYYEATDPTNVPQIFTRETMQATKSAIKEDLYGAVLTGDHVMLSGWKESDLPNVLGYVMTEPKPATQVLMAAETGDPLLAVGRFGLGQGLCWTADLTEKWGGEWLAWENCGKFWAQVFRGIVRKSDSDGLEVRSSIIGETMRLEISRKNSDGTPVSNLKWDARAIDENSRELPLSIAETGLGRYAATVPLIGKEKLTLRLRDADSDKVKVLSYNKPAPPEYRLAQNVEASITNLPAFAQTEVRQGIEPIRTRRSVDSAFYLLALGCALGSIVLRRV